MSNKNDESDNFTPLLKEYDIYISISHATQSKTNKCFV